MTSKTIKKRRRRPKFDVLEVFLVFLGRRRRPENFENQSPPMVGGESPDFKRSQNTMVFPLHGGGESPDFRDLSPPMVGGDYFFWRSVPPHHGGGKTGCFESPPMGGDTRSGILEAEAWAQSEVSKQAKSI